MKKMKVIIASDKKPTVAELEKLENAKKMLEDAGLGIVVELIGTRPNDR